MFNYIKKHPWTVGVLGFIMIQFALMVLGIWFIVPRIIAVGIYAILVVFHFIMEAKTSEVSNMFNE